MGKLASVIFEKGIYEGKFFEDWIRQLLLKKNVKTFGDLVLSEYNESEQYRFKLRVIASDVSRGRMLVLPQDIADYGIRPEDLNVATAVRMSMSIPFFYEPIKLKNMKTGDSSYIVDGGVLSNFPIWLFDPGNDEEAWPTFGFKLVEPETKAEIQHSVKGPVSLLTALFSTMMEAHDAQYIKDANYVRTIGIPTLGIGTTEFNISTRRSDDLYNSGRQAAETFFSGWSFENYVENYRRGTPILGRRQRLNLSSRF